MASVIKPRDRGIHEMVKLAPLKKGRVLGTEFLFLSNNLPEPFTAVHLSEPRKQELILWRDGPVDEGEKEETHAAAHSLFPFPLAAAFLLQSLLYLQTLAFVTDNQNSRTPT